MSYQIDCVELKSNDYEEKYGKFIFESLEQGEGITLGNSLRRILLADLTGIAIVALRIAGINNEFSIIQIHVMFNTNKCLCNEKLLV